MRIFDADATREALPFERLIPALRSLFASGCNVPPRHVHTVTAAPGEAFTSLIMPAWLEGRYYGVKVINIAPANAGRGLPGLHASYLLHDGITGVPLALIDGDQITTRRTAAASALAASWLARPDASHLLVVGAGQVARLLLDAYRCVRRIDKVAIWTRRPEQSEDFARELQTRGINAFAEPDLQAAVSAADIVSCATLATEPLIQGRWLQPGSHLDLIGSFTPAMREADDACFVDAALYLDTEEALQKSGELLGPMSRGIFGPADVRGTLSSLSRGEASGRTSADQRTVFKSVGLALEDLAAAIAVYEPRTAGLPIYPATPTG